MTTFTVSGVPAALGPGTARPAHAIRCRCSRQRAHPQRARLQPNGRPPPTAGVYFIHLACAFPMYLCRACRPHVHGRLEQGRCASARGGDVQGRGERTQRAIAARRWRIRVPVGMRTRRMFLIRLWWGDSRVCLAAIVGLAPNYASIQPRSC